MIPSLFELFSISPRVAGIVAASALTALVVLDIYATGDRTPHNTPRQIVVGWTAWSGRIFGIPLTGAPIPFVLGVLLGHWFHPGNAPRITCGFAGLAVVAGIAVILTVATGVLGTADRSDGDRTVGWQSARWSGPLAAVGTLAGVLFWPVGC